MNIDPNGITPSILQPQKVSSKNENTDDKVSSHEIVPLSKEIFETKQINNTNSPIRDKKWTSGGEDVLPVGNLEKLNVSLPTPTEIKELTLLFFNPGEPITPQTWIKKFVDFTKKICEQYSLKNEEAELNLINASLQFIEYSEAEKHINFSDPYMKGFFQGIFPYLKLESARLAIISTFPEAICLAKNSDNSLEQAAIIENRKLAAGLHPKETAKNITQYPIVDEKERIEIAKIIAAIDAKAIIENFDRFAIEDESARVDIFKITADQNLEVACAHIGNFTITNEDKLVNIAAPLAAKNGKVVLRHRKHFQLSEETWNKEVAVIAQKQMAPFAERQEQIEKVFCALGDNMWKQVIDGKYHQFGKNVFDEGLHKGHVEPGFLKSLNNGLDLAKEYLGEKLSVDFYKLLHKTLCSHFKGRENHTEVTSDKIGLFRTSCLNPCKFKALVENDEIQDHGLSLIEKVKSMNTDLEFLCNRLHIPKIVNIRAEGEDVFVDYFFFPVQDFEKIVQSIVDHYNDTMQGINATLSTCSDEKEKASLMQEKIKAIAQIYQLLDWLHPFPDGQGRTDLVLLGKLLTEEGLNPALLNEPYFSSYSTLSEWQKYLSKGTELWKDEAAVSSL